MTKKAAADARILRAVELVVAVSLRRELAAAARLVDQHKRWVERVAEALVDNPDLSLGTVHKLQPGPVARVRPAPAADAPPPATARTGQPLTATRVLRSDLANLASERVL